MPLPISRYSDPSLTIDRINTHLPIFQNGGIHFSAPDLSSSPTALFWSFNITMASMKLHRDPPFRAEHLGSLLRPAKLLKAREGVIKGAISKDELTKIEDESVKEIVDVQLKAGFRAITDGEYRRHQFWGTFFPGLEGFTVIHDPPADIFRPYMPDIAAFTNTGLNPGESVICTGKIKHVGSTYIDQWNYLKSLVPPDKVKDCKLTLAAPEWYHMRYRNGRAYSKDVYANDDEYFADIAQAYQTELGILYNAGLRNIQFDDPNLAYFCSDSMMSGWKADPLNTCTVEDQLHTYIKLYNDCISHCPPDMHIGVHLCRGNFANSVHFAEGSYDAIATTLFETMKVHTFYLEYDTHRAGGFEPLKHLPLNKSVILGIVTSKFPKLEDPAEMKERVMQAAQFVAEGNNVSKEEALKRLGVSPQCGFASHEAGNAIDWDGMVKKLDLVRSIADSIWEGEA
ncbi:MAG: hypothetical protein M1834_005537 [Cirrosporium novae-zelandiae]|nr:MAG: hypothetical protein M1834_005537 [Cirrosporium novae-zelandiae]